MKTNVSIKFNSIEEYRVIEKKLEEMGYVNDKEWYKKVLSNSSTHVVVCHFVKPNINNKFEDYNN